MKVSLYNPEREREREREGGRERARERHHQHTERLYMGREGGEDGGEGCKPRPNHTFAFFYLL